jgi:hypothetical protein
MQMLIFQQCRSLSYVLETSKQGTSPISTRNTDDDGSDFEFRLHQLQSKEALLESSLNEQRQINLDLESDLKIALAEGIKYRDSLKKIIEIRELEESRLNDRRYLSSCILDGMMY